MHFGTVAKGAPAAQRRDQRSGCAGSSGAVAFARQVQAPLVGLQGRPRQFMRVSALPLLARTLGVSVEGLIGEDASSGTRSRSAKLMQHMERINALPKAQ